MIRVAAKMLDTAILCYDDFPFFLAGVVPDVSSCTQAWSTCADFQQFQFQCTWNIVASEIELKYRADVKIAGDYFALSVRVSEWIEDSPRYLLFSVWPDGDRSCVQQDYEILLEPSASLTCVTKFDPATYTTMVPENYFLTLSDVAAVADGALLEIYAGAFPSHDRNSYIGSTYFAAVVTFVNRDPEKIIRITPQMGRIAKDKIVITPNSNAPTFLSSLKYPWIFEEDLELFAETVITVNYNQITCTKLTIDGVDGGTFEIGLTKDNVHINSRKNYTSTSAGTSNPLTENVKLLKFTPSKNHAVGGFRIVLYGDIIAYGDLTTPKISPDVPNFLLNLVNIFGN
ncbi:unnamed protein product, partial [Mesorhabditis spiculigera]